MYIITPLMQESLQAHIFNEWVLLFLVDGDHLKLVTLKFNKAPSTTTILKLSKSCQKQEETNINYQLHGWHKVQSMAHIINSQTSIGYTPSTIV